MKKTLKKEWQHLVIEERLWIRLNSLLENQFAKLYQYTRGNDKCYELTARLIEWIEQALGTIRYMLQWEAV